MVILDVELTFKSGVKDYVTLQEGRDTFEKTNQRLHLVIHHEDGAVEDIDAELAAIACIKTARREVKPEPTIDSAGLVKAEA